MSADKQVALEFNRLRGRMLGLIESWGLSRDPGGAAREAGMKSTLKHLTYEAEAKITDLVQEKAAT